MSCDGYRSTCSQLPAPVASSQFSQLFQLSSPNSPSSPNLTILTMKQTMKKKMQRLQSMRAHNPENVIEEYRCKALRIQHARPTVTLVIWHSKSSCIFNTVQFIIITNELFLYIPKTNISMANCLLRIAGLRI